MKSALASFAAVVVLTTAVPTLNLQQAGFPPWLCDIFPMFCSRR